MHGARKAASAVLSKINFELLRKTKYIEPEVIEKNGGIKQEYANYSLMMMEVCALIENQFQLLFNVDIMARRDHGGLRILSIPASKTHGWSSAKMHRLAFERWVHKTNLVVKPSQLDDDAQRKDHEAKQQLYGRMLLHMKEDEIQAMQDDDDD